MGTKRKVAIWYLRDKRYVVMMPGWENKVDLSFTSKAAMKEWASGMNLMLRDGNRPKEAT